MDWCHIVSIVLWAVVSYGWTTTKICSSLIVRNVGKKVAGRFSQPPIPHCSSPSSLLAPLYFHLTSALEVQTQNIVDSVPPISWIDLCNFYNPDYSDEIKKNSYMPLTKAALKMPLYPLPAVHLPDWANTNFTLWNIEQRNIQMTLDLEYEMLSSTATCTSGAEEYVIDNGLFCVVLQAKDTGRIVPIGTVVRVLQIEKEEKYDFPTEPDWDGMNNATNFRRIIVTCVPVALVDILDIENPHAALKEYRYRHPNEYLMATVRYRCEMDIGHDLLSQSSVEVALQESICLQIHENYNRVRSFYLESSVATRNWPPRLVSQIKSSRYSSLPALDEANSLLSMTEFWSIAQSWQMLCETVRAVREMALVANRNEYMVSAAIRKGGPLQLPVHLEDLHKEDRMFVQCLENSAQQHWLDLELDPCIDFYVLMSMQIHSERLRFFSKMVERELRRLEELLLHDHGEGDDELPLYGNNDNYLSDIRSNDMTDHAPSRKGAWFNDEYW
jgi:hypothetical protein